MRFRKQKPTPPASRNSALSEHAIEKRVAHQLHEDPSLQIENLVVRRMPNDAIFLEGVLKTDDTEFDLSDYLKGALGVDEVINRVTRRSPSTDGEETVCSGEDTVVDWK